MKRARQTGHRPGFTLVEIMVVVLLMGILLSISAVALGPVYQGQRVNKAAVQVVGFLNFARDLSMMAGKPVQVSVTDARILQLKIDGQSPAATTTYGHLGYDTCKLELSPGITLAVKGGSDDVNTGPGFAAQEVTYVLSNGKGRERRVHLLAGSGRAEVVGGGK